MKSNKNISLTLANSLNIKQLSSPNHRHKVQGFDKNHLSSTFTSKIEKLKNKPKKEVLQDQYIHGLQDQIKFLEMQLKLLQQKDIQKHGQIDQLEKFFGDGIPINENILAMKNGFNNYKSNNQKKFKDLSHEKQERSVLIESLAIKVEKLMDELNENEKKNRVFSEDNNSQWFRMIGKEAGLRKTIQKEEQILKALKMDNRKLHENLQKMARNKMIENMSIIKYQNNKNTKLTNLKDSICQKQEQVLALQKEYLQLKKESQQKAYIIKLQEENLSNRKKMIILQRQSDNMKSKIKEKHIQLQQKLKERMFEIHCKIDMQNKVNQLKESINRANTLTVEEVNRAAKEKEIEYLKHVLDNNKKLIKYTDYYSNILSHGENQIQSLAMRKPEVKSEITALNSEILQLKKSLQEQKLRQISLHSQMVQVEQKFNLTNQTLLPFQEHTKKSKEKILSYLQERIRLMQQIKIKEKQLELIFILKSLSFQQAEISKSSNKNLQEELANFIKNWDKIQRNP